MLPYTPANDPPPKVDGMLEQVLVEAGYHSPSPLLPPPPPPQPHSIQPIRMPPQTEERFMDAFMLFSNLTGIRLNEQDFFIDGHQVNPWELYRTVSLRNGFDSVTMNGGWPMVGVDLGFHPISCGDPHPLAHCTPAVAHQLHQLYQNTLRHFDQAYSRGIINQLEYLHTTGQRPSPAQPQALQRHYQPLAYQPTEADYQALLATIATSESSSAMTFEEAKNILLRFCDVSAAELEAHRVPQHVIAYVEHNREDLKWQAQNPRFCTGFTPIGSPQFVHQNLFNGVQAIPRPSLHSPQNHPQLQQRHSDRESMHGDAMKLSLPQQQIILALRAQVQQGNMTHNQALDRLAIMQASSAHSFEERSAPQQLPPGFNAGGVPSGNAHQQMDTLSQHAQVSANNQINTLQRVIQAQDPSHAHQFNMFPPDQQQQNGSGIASRMGQNINPSGIGFPRGPGSLQQHFIQSSPSVPHANPQPSSTPSASHIPEPGAQQVSGPPGTLADVPLPQLRALSTQLLHVVMEGEKNLQATSSSGEGDIQRQQLRAKIELNKQRLRALHEVINMKMMPSGDPTQRFPQGPASLQQNFIQPSPPVSHANPQPSSTPSASQIPQPVSDSLGNILDVPLQQLRTLSTQLLHVVMEGEKNLQATSSSGESDIQRQQLRAKIELNKERLRALHEVINMKMMRSGDPTQQPVNSPSWPGSGQRPTGLYHVAERPGQHNSPSLHQASANQAPPQRSIPTPQQNFVPSAPQSNLTQIPSHVSANGPSSNSILAQINGAPQQQSPQITHPPSQPPIQPNKLPCLSEDRFNSNLMQFTRSKGIRLSERDIVIDDRRINLWALHRAVFSQNGFESVSAHDEWPVIGAALGFPPVAGGDPGRPPRCGPVIAQRLQQLYNGVLRHFDQVYISSIVARLRNSQTSGQLPQPQAQPHQPMEADYQAPLASTTSETSVMNTETMNILPRLSHTSGAELEAHHVPQNHAMPVSMNPAAMNGVRSSSIFTQSPSVSQIRRPTQEDLTGAKRWIEEKKRMAFSSVPNFDRVASTIPESDIQEYQRNLERLDQVLVNIEKYIHFAFAALKKEEVVGRLFGMMASAKTQLEELKRPNPRYALELHTIRGMIQEADNMDKGLKAVLQRIQAQMMPRDGVPSAPQPPPRLDSILILPPPTSTRDPPQRDDSEPARSPEGSMSHHEGLFDEEVRIAMNRLKI